MRINVHLTAADLVKLREQNRKDTAQAWKAIGIFFGICLALWPYLNLDTHPFIAWPLAVIESVLILSAISATVDQWRRK